jgi:Damage-control phosphatase ARMT1-like domain
MKIQYLNFIFVVVVAVAVAVAVVVVVVVVVVVTSVRCFKYCTSQQQQSIPNMKDGCSLSFAWQFFFFLLTSSSSIPTFSFAWSNPTTFSSTTTGFNRRNTCTAMSSSSSTAKTSTTYTTTSCRGPRIELAEVILSLTPGTWAYDTMNRRVDAEILERTEQDNREQLEQWPDVKQRFQNLRHELQNAGATVITYPNEPPENASAERLQEYQEWKDILQPFVEKQDTWLSAPWMVAEFLVYRKLMDVLDYWNPASPGYLYDPFFQQKQAGLESSPASAEAMLGRINNLPTAASTVNGLEIAASIALWGNKMDLSLWPANADTANQDVFTDILQKAHENLLHDDSEALAAYCETLQKKNDGGNVDIIVDNAGFELVTDLALAQYLVASGIAKTVTFQLKSHPLFVSDALEKDLRATVDYYKNNLPADRFPDCHAAATIWQEYLDQGQWKCTEHSFWTQGAAMWKMPDSLYNGLQTRCDLAFVKGDANYRRLLGDLTWHYSNDSFQDIVGAYFPCPVCALRTLKAQVGCGMEADKVARAAATGDPESWLTNGRFGVVQFDRATKSLT